MNQARVFFSYAHENAAEVEELYDDLVEAGVRPWMDTRDLLPGQDWDLAIASAIADADAVVVCLSTVSVNKEGYLQREIERARARWMEKRRDEIFIIPVRLDECTIPESLATFQAVSLSSRRGFTRLSKAIAAACASRTAADEETAHNEGVAAGSQLKFFSYVSRPKVEMLLPQLRRDTEAMITAGTVADCLMVIERLNEHKLVAAFDDHTSIAAGTFYSSSGTWRVGLFCFQAFGSAAAVAYFAWRRFDSTLVLLAGSPDNVIGRRVAQDGISIPTTGDIMQSLEPSIRDIMTSEEVSPAKGLPRRRVYVQPLDENRRIEQRRNRIYTNIPLATLSLFCLRDLATLPEMNIETVFRIYRQSAHHGDALADLEAENAAGRAEYPTLFDEQSLTTARTLGLAGIRHIYVGSPLYVAIA